VREIDGGSADSGDNAADAGRDHGSHQATWAEVQARIARWDEIPTSEQAGAKTWGPDAEYWDEDEQAWRTPDSTPSPGDQEAAPAFDATSVPDGAAESAGGVRGDHADPASTNDQADAAEQPDKGDRAPDKASETVDELRQRVADLKAANARLETWSAELGAGMTEQQSKNAELSTRVTELVSQNAELGKSVTELRSENAQLRAELKAEKAERSKENAELRRGMSAYEARLEGLAQKDAVRPDASKKLDIAENADEKTRRYPGRGVLTSDAAIGLAAAAGSGIVSMVPYYSRHLPPADAGIMANLILVGAGAVVFGRKFREGKDAAHRPKD
jgi:hypothetical protein